MSSHRCRFDRLDRANPECIPRTILIQTSGIRFASANFICFPASIRLPPRVRMCVACVMIDGRAAVWFRFCLASTHIWVSRTLICRQFNFFFFFDFISDSNTHTRLCANFSESIASVFGVARVTVTVAPFSNHRLDVIKRNRIREKCVQVNLCNEWAFTSAASRLAPRDQTLKIETNNGIYGVR